MMHAGKEIDPNNLLPEDFPMTTERSRLAHFDSSAVAKYFNLVIRGILDTIVGYGKKDGGVFGAVKNYYGIIEYQDRGTRHCHILIWLTVFLTPSHCAPNSRKTTSERVWMALRTSILKLAGMK
jgi:hypothetical protein